MSDIKKGVNPVYDIKFGICLTGRPEENKGAEYAVVADAENLNISINGNVEEWNSMDAEGWARRLMTGKSISIGMGGKRNYGDPGNDYVASLATKTGQVCNNTLRITFPNGDIFYMPCVLNVTTLGGASNGIESLEWEALSDGKPEYVPYAQATQTSE